MVNLADLEEAIALEQKGGRWEARHVAAALGISRATVYRTPWLLAIRRKSGAQRGAAVRWEPREVRVREALRQGHDPQTALRAVGG